MERIGMTRDLEGDFEHPRVPEGHPIRPHVLYRFPNGRPQVSNPSLLVRTATSDEAPLLRGIQLLSKAHWGYPDETIARFAEVISMSPEYVHHADVWVIEDAGYVAGWHSLAWRADVMELHNLWVVPSRIGHRVGRWLYEHALTRAGELGATRLEWEAEPNAVGFYEHMGAKHLREATSVLGNPISWMGVDLRPLTQGSELRVRSRANSVRVSLAADGRGSRQGDQIRPNSARWPRNRAATRAQDAWDHVAATCGTGWP
ncbi:MAG: GNAT family N-acetyltransferase [Candidatus Dormibacteria bacterium]